jgi:SAM-dependent methyltransferase
MTMNMPDAFDGLARYYDQLMNHVSYERWLQTTLALAELTPAGKPHLDAACGTGTLGRQLRSLGWQSYGADLSVAMVRAARKEGPFPAAVADLRALPFAGRMGMITCLFDSLNFLLELDHLKQAFQSLYESLAPGGILYCDIVTERMVIEHFDGQEWVEEDGNMTTSWASTYDPRTGIADSHIRINQAGPYLIRERVYDTGVVSEAMKQAGLTLLAAVDAETWKAPRKKTLRVDFVAVKGDGRRLQKPFKKIADDIARQLHR